jgi:hypothetical protein
LVRCKAESVSGWWYLGVASIGPNAGQTLEATLAGTFTASEAVAGPLTVDCWRQTGLGSAPVVDVAEAVAIQVGTISIVGM